MRLRTGQRSAGVLIASILGILMTVSCGSPEYTYVANSEERTYVRLPVAWQAVDPDELAAALGLDTGAALSEQGL